MESENQAPLGADRSWSTLLTIVILVIGAIVAVHIADIVSSARSETGPGADSYSSVMQGDYLVKYALAFGKDQRDRYANEAIVFYQKAAPSPGAYRRIGLTRETVLGQSGWNDLKKIDSPAATASFSAKERKQYAREVRLWRHIYGLGEFDKAQASDYISQIDKLELGPQKKLALADVYEKAGQSGRAHKLRVEAKDEAQVSIFTLFAVFGTLVLIGLLGLVLAILFFASYGAELKHAPRPAVQHTVLFTTFLAYLLSYLGLGVVISSILQLSGLDLATSAGLLVGAVLQLSAMICAFALGLSALWTMTAHTGEDPRKIGYIKLPWAESIKWGFGGFAAMLPFYTVALFISTILSNTVFRNVPTPENEVIQYLSAGSPAVMILTILMAVIAAPVVEETFFRGALYGALRAKMSVWGAALLSAALFAAIHPLPGHFLPIMVIGTALALIREKTGSLLPSMICHGLYNGTIMLLALLAQ